MRIICGLNFSATKNPKPRAIENENVIVEKTAAASGPDKRRERNWENVGENWKNPLSHAEYVDKQIAPKIMTSLSFELLVDDSSAILFVPLSSLFESTLYLKK